MAIARSAASTACSRRRTSATPALYQADATLVALDAKTGTPVWSVKNGDPTKGATGTSAPLVVTIRR